MGAVYVEIGAGHSLGAGSTTLFPDHKLVCTGWQFAHIGRKPFAGQIACLGTDRDDRIVQPVAFLALVLVRYAVADGLASWRDYRNARTCNRQRSVGLLRVPDIGQRHPAAFTVE